MGTTGTPDGTGVAKVEESEGKLGAEPGAFDADLPYDRPPGPDDEVHRSPRYGQG